MTYATEIVYIACRQLRYRPPLAEPLGLTYHKADYHAYEFATKCGLAYRDRRDRTDVATVGIRRDTADLIASPCRRCWP